MPEAPQDERPLTPRERRAACVVMLLASGAVYFLIWLLVLAVTPKLSTPAGWYIPAAFTCITALAAYLDPERTYGFFGKLMDFLLGKGRRL
jgi:hypothetical protein